MATLARNCKSVLSPHRRVFRAVHKRVSLPFPPPFFITEEDEDDDDDEDDIFVFLKKLYHQDRLLHHHNLFRRGDGTVRRAITITITTTKHAS